MFPQTIDNNYRGHKLALWLFGALLLMRLVMSVNSLLNGRAVLTGADGVPLDTYPPTAAQTIVALFALMACSQLVMCVLGGVALIRYRGMIPLLFALQLVEHLGRRVVLNLIPIVRVGAPPAGVITLILLAFMVVGLALSLWDNRSHT